MRYVKLLTSTCLTFFEVANHRKKSQRRPNSRKFRQGCIWRKQALRTGCMLSGNYYLYYCICNLMRVRTGSYGIDNSKAWARRIHHDAAYGSNGTRSARHCMWMEMSGKCLFFSQFCAKRRGKSEVIRFVTKLVFSFMMFCRHK